MTEQIIGTLAGLALGTVLLLTGQWWGDRHARRYYRAYWEERTATFHTEQRTIMTHDGPMTVQVPVLDDPSVLNLEAGD